MEQMMKKEGMGMEMAGASMAAGKKEGKGMMMGMMACAVLAIAGIGFGVYELMQANSARQQIADLKVEIKNNDGTTTTLDTDKIEIKDDANTIVITDSNKENETADVKKVVLGLYEAFSNNGFIGHHVFGDGSIVPISGTDILTSTSESYGFDTGRQANNDVEMKVLNNGEQIATSYLTNNGFTRIKDLAFNSGLYYNQEKDIYCTVPGGSFPYNVYCTKASWLAEDEKQLALELAEAAETTTIFAKTEEIEDSPISPYQRLIASTSGAAMLFYRTSPNDKWTFLTGTQMIVSCEKYNEDAKKAYAGTKCWDTATDSEVTL